MGREGVDLRDPRHGGHEGGADGPSGSDQVSVLDGLPDQLLGDDVHDRVAVGNNGAQFPLQTFLDDFGQGVAVHAVGLVIADPAQVLITVGDDRRTLVGADGGQGVHHIRDPAWIVDDHLLGFFCAQIGKLLQHLARGVKIQRGGVLIGHAHALLDDGPVDLILGIKEMHVSRGNNRLSRLLAQAHDRAVEVQKILFRFDLRIFVLHFGRFQKETVVVAGLDLQIIIEIHDARKDLIRALLQNSLHQLAHDTGAADQDSLPVFHKQALGYTRLFEKISQVRFTDQGVEVGPAGRIFGQQDTVVGPKALDRVRRRPAEGIDLAQGQDILLLQKGQHFHPDPRRTLGIIHGSVVIVQRYSQQLGHCVQGVFGVAGQQGPGHSQGVRRRKMTGQAQTSGVGSDEADVKLDVVSHKDTAFAEAQEIRQHLFDRLCADDHAVGNAGELGDPVGDGQLRVDKFGKAVADLSLLDLDRADLDNFVLFRRKAGGLQVEDHDRPVLDGCVQILFGNGHNTLYKVVDQIAFHAVEDLEKVLAVDGGLSLFLPLLIFGFQ